MFLREAVQRGLPVLGVCLGGQLLSRALGAPVTHMPEKMVGWYEVSPLPAAAEDPLFSRLPDPVTLFHWNEDAFALPDGAVELVSRAGPGVEAFRLGARAWGVQCHPEADAADARRLVRRGARTGRSGGARRRRAQPARAAQNRRDDLRRLCRGRGGGLSGRLHGRVRAVGDGRRFRLRFRVPLPLLRGLARGEEQLLERGVEAVGDVRRCRAARRSRRAGRSRRCRCRT